LHSGFCIESEAGCHNPGFTKASRTEGAHARSLRVGKALAATAVDVLTQKDYLQEIKNEFENMVKGAAKANVV
jgi:hypothetical protein